MDRILTCDHPPFAATLSGGTYTLAASGYRLIGTGSYVHSTTIDLGGYTRQDDLTVFFRNSFEQRGGNDLCFWSSYDPNKDAIQEQVIISSVPFTDNQLLSTVFFSPGFTPGPVPGFDFGNFDRTHIIHGHLRLYFANAVIGSGAFTSTGYATLQALTDNVYSSLEPTAADTLYCYRLLFLPPADTSNLTNISMAPSRVLMSITTDEEPDLSYMMRLKRSYELANQV